MDQFDVSDVIRTALEQRLAAVHVSLPATVVSYSAAANTCTARPRVKRLVPTAEDGVYRAESLPDIPGVRVAWPAGGGSSLVLTLDPGDPVELVFSDTDPSTARATGEVSEPADVRRHSLAHAWAIPGGGGTANAIPGGPRLVLGGVGDSAALASRVKALETAFNTHTHAVAVAGVSTPVATPFAATGTAAPPPPANITYDSIRIKVDA